MIYWKTNRVVCEGPISVYRIDRLLRQSHFFSFPPYISRTGNIYAYKIEDTGNKQAGNALN